MTRSDRGSRQPRRPHEPFEQDAGEQAGFGGYVVCKARRLAQLGAARYREEDFFNQPSEGFDADQLQGVLDGCAQLAEERGLDADTPLTGISVASTYALIQTLHFGVVARRSQSSGEGFLDVLRCQHQVSGSFGLLFVLVVYEKEAG